MAVRGLAALWLALAVVLLCCLVAGECRSQTEPSQGASSVAESADGVIKEQLDMWRVLGWWAGFITAILVGLTAVLIVLAFGVIGVQLYRAKRHEDSIRKIEQDATASIQTMQKDLASGIKGLMLPKEILDDAKKDYEPLIDSVQQMTVETKKDILARVDTLDQIVGTLREKVASLEARSTNDGKRT